MNSLQLLTDFWKEATFEDYSRMMDVVLPHTGESYRKGKFQRFQSNLSKWLCDLTPENLKKVERYLHINAIAESYINPVFKVDRSLPSRFENELQQFSKDTLTTYLAVMVNEDRYQALLNNLNGIEELLFTKITETGSADFDATAPASETDELTKTKTHQS